MAITAAVRQCSMLSQALAACMHNSHVAVSKQHNKTMWDIQLVNK